MATHEHTKVRHLSKSDFAEAVKEGNRLVLVDFWAPWCPPCLALAPTLDALAEEFDGRAVIAKVNIDEYPELAAAQGVRSIPTMLFYRDGQVVTRKLGNTSKGELRSAISSLVDS